MDTKLKEYRKEWETNLKDVKISFEAKLDELRLILDKKDKVIGKLNQEVGRLNHDVGKLIEENNALSKEHDDTKNTLNFLTKETTDLGKSVDDNKDAIKLSRDVVDSVQNKTADLEDRSRRNNIVFFNIAESENDNENCGRLVKDVLRYHKIIDPNPNVDDQWFDRAHRLGPISKKREGKTRPIIVRFTYYRQKEEILVRGSYLRDSKVNMSEDYSRTTIDISTRNLSVLPKLLKLQTRTSKASN